jgi:hypothetical protein
MLSLNYKNQKETSLEDPSGREHIRNILRSVRPPKTSENIIERPAGQQGLEKFEVEE